MPNEFWDIRYSQPDYAYGIKPNAYFKYFIDHHLPGKVLLPGEGEGRNAVYAARKGWKVMAIDQSPEGKRKSEDLAEKNDVSFNYWVGNLLDYPFQADQFDAVALIFLHLPPDIRLHIHKQFINSLAPGGFLLVEAFSKGQLGRLSGGPQVNELLYDKMLLRQDFQPLEIMELYETEEWLDEGPFHQGQAALVRLMAQK
jgi:SAM-dependent methyltransferase